MITFIWLWSGLKTAICTPTFVKKNNCPSKRLLGISIKPVMLLNIYMRMVYFIEILNPRIFYWIVILMLNYVILVGLVKNSRVRGIPSVGHTSTWHLRSCLGNLMTIE